MSVLLDDPIVLKPESSQLLSCWEVDRKCPGTFDREDCGLALDPELEICQVCMAAEAEHYRQRALKEDGHKPMVYYRHLTD